LITSGRVRRTRRARVASRGLPLLLLAGAAFVGGAMKGGAHEPVELTKGSQFLAAWERGDYAAMHALLAPDVRRRVTLREFSSAYRRAAATSTLQRVRRTGPPVAGEGAVTLPVVARTRVFGDLRGRLTFTLRGEDDAQGLTWARHQVLPGLRKGEKLSRTVTMPPRGELQARDGTVLATGETRFVEGLDPQVREIVGAVGPIPADQQRDYERRGYPKDAIVGLNGLERELESRLAGTPGGALVAGSRTLAEVAPKPARAIRSSIAPGVQRAAVQALAGRLGGIAVIRPSSGEVLGLAGLAFSAPQPPGSAFKIITLAGALEAGTVKTSAKFPVETKTTLEGVELENANGETCGGSLANSFAHSCNTVFAPMGAELGAPRLYRAATAFGFNEEPTLRGQQPSTIPPAEELGDDLGVGSTAIGQGRLLATPVHLATVAAAIANDGELVRPTVLKGGKTKRSRATEPRVARTIERFMRRVVTDGTGTAAKIDGVVVAGKTGTAELRDTTPDPEEQELAPDGAAQPSADDTTDTTAWFVAFAPGRRPRVAVAVMLVGQGAGGATAAPAAREVLLAALKD
jgi:penicillin-binding protein A